MTAIHFYLKWDSKIVFWIFLPSINWSSYNATVEEVDVVEATKDETESVVEGYSWEDFMLDDDYYSNAEYKSNGGPPTLTLQNYCEYNG